MKLAKFFFFFLCLQLAANALRGQYYATGEVKDEKSVPISNARIFLHSSRRMFFTGSYGDFGMVSSLKQDTITVSKDGYETKVVVFNTATWQEVVLKVPTMTANKNRPRLVSITKDLTRTQRVKWQVDNESYFQIIENDFINADRFPNTGFSLNVNKASYANVRRFINENSAVPPDAVRSEELINYFNLRYKAPISKNVFEIESQETDCPYDANKNLLFINTNAKTLDMDKVPSGNFVFLIDASGSMDMPNKLPLLKAAFQMFVKNLREKDTVSIVIYGGTVAIWLKPTSGAEKEKIISRIEELEAVGDTPGESAILMAYKLAEKTFIKDGNNRVILATDGDFNVGIAEEKDLEDLIVRERQKNVFLTCLGVGMGNFKDSKLETLAKRGNGNYAYIDNVLEAEKVMVKELTQTMYAVADDVFLNITFNPKYVKEYRLIGFDNKKDAVADSTMELDGGEIGSGNSTMAIFEIVPTQSKLLEQADMLNTAIANIQLRYSNCNDTALKYINYPVLSNFQKFEKADSSYQFATAVAMFAMKLRQSAYLKDVTYEALEEIAYKAFDHKNYLQKDFIALLSKARAIYGSKKKKGKKN